MLKANVGLSRKLSKDYNSTGFTVNLDGEITAPLSDPEAFLQQMRELWDLAEETLNQQIERAQGEASIASRDVDPPSREPLGDRPQPNRAPSNGRRETSSPSTNGQSSHGPEAATNKQIQFLLTIAKRQQLTTVQVEKKIAEILGRSVGLYDLTKKDAAVVIGALTGEGGNPTTNGNSRSKTRHSFPS